MDKTTKVKVFYESHHYRQPSRHQPCLPTSIAGKMTPGRCPQNPGSVTLARDPGFCISMQHPTHPCADGPHTGDRWSAHGACRRGSYGRHTRRAFRPFTRGGICCRPANGALSGCPDWIKPHLCATPRTSLISTVGIAAEKGMYICLSFRLDVETLVHKFQTLTFQVTHRGTTKYPSTFSTVPLFRIAKN